MRARSGFRSTVGLLVAVAAGSVLAGCAGTAPSVEPPVATVSLSAPPAVSWVPATDHPPAESSPATTASGEVTVSGTVIEGAQPSCRNLQTDGDGRYTLTGPGTATLTVGDRIIVIGQPRPDLVSPCGRVFVVTSIR